MTNSWTCTIPLRPVPKGRPRLGRGGARTPKRTRAFEKECAWLLKKAWFSGRERYRFGTLTCAVEVRAVFIMPRPKSLTHRKNGGTLAASKPEVTPPHISVPDLSNLIKALEDAIEKSGIIANDSQFNSIRAAKRYAEVGEEVGITVELRW